MLIREDVLIVVSNREPYLHQKTEDGSVVCRSDDGWRGCRARRADARARRDVDCTVPGPADRETVDAHDESAFPDRRASTDLRRIWPTESEERAITAVFSNEGLWPLCHMVNVAPVFREEDWAAYRDVNRRFAEAIASETDRYGTPIFIQDYHLALVARGAAWRRGRPPARRSSGTSHGRSRSAAHVSLEP